jgi:hypothetical protein
LKGSGSIPAINFGNGGGKLSPGTSIGKMTFNNSEDFSSSILEIDVNGGGGLPGTDFDEIKVMGFASLGAGTTLNLVFNYAVVNGSTFDILTATTISGTIPLANISFTNTSLGNVTAVSVSYPATGIVRVTVTSPLVNYPYQLVDEDILTVFETNIINDEEKQIEVASKAPCFTIYPNPVSGGGMNILFTPIGENEFANIRVFDLQGRLILQEKISNVGGFIETKGFASGAYIFEAQTNGEIFRKKLIIE